MSDMAPRADRGGDEGQPTSVRHPRRRRVDAERNRDAVLTAARQVFATTGVDAPAKEITDLAGVGVGTLYRHFPQRSDLVKAVLQQEISACAEDGDALASADDAAAALANWLWRYAEFLATKDGLASALHSSRASFDALRNHILESLGPTCKMLLDRAVASGAMYTDLSANGLLFAVAKLCMPVDGEAAEDRQRAVALLIDGMRHRSPISAPAPPSD